MKFALYTNKNKRFTLPAFLWLAATVLFIGFMFSRSLTPAVESSKQSGVFVYNMNNFFSLFNINIEVTSLFVRKAAHFAEYFVYGVLLTLAVLNLTGYIKKNMFSILFFALLVPVADETLQYFSPGRSSEVKDVLLDFAGCLAGIALVSLIRFIVVSNRRKKRKLRLKEDERDESNIARK